MAKILVIDDDVIVRKTIIRLLEDGGYKVLSAEDGLRGMAMFRSEQPDLVITDIITPEQEGIQTITEMRKAKPDAKIIAISGSARIRKRRGSRRVRRAIRRARALRLVRV
jgi:CheY-like chemotaxis protein